MRKIALLSSAAVLVATGAYAQDIVTGTLTERGANFIEIDEITYQLRPWVTIPEGVDRGDMVRAQLDSRNDELKIISLNPADAEGGEDAGAMFDDGLFGYWDADRSGTVSEDEYSQRSTNTVMFNMFDANGDGEISFDEYTTGLFAVFDEDNDGVLTSTEWDNGIDAWLGEEAVDLTWSDWDADGNGELSPQEFRTSYEGYGQYSELAGADEYIDQSDFADASFAFADVDRSKDLNEDEFDLFGNWFE